MTISLDGQLVNLESLLATGINTLRDLALGARIEVDGILDTRTGVITATRLTARDPLVRIEAPLEQIVGDLISVLGQTALLVPGAGDAQAFSGDEQMAISAFTDSAGQILLPRQNLLLLRTTRTLFCMARSPRLILSAEPSLSPASGSISAAPTACWSTPLMV